MLRTNVRSSVDRATEQGDLFGVFFELLLNSNLKIRSKFIGGEVSKHKESLREGIETVLLAAEGDSNAQNQLTKLRETHSRDNIGVDPMLYRYWVDSFLRALELLDPEYSSDLEREWREIMHQVTSHMAEGYEDWASQVKKLAN